MYQLWRRTRLSGDRLEWWRRRVVSLTLIAWLPLLLLSIAQGHAWGTGVGLPFLGDFGMHARLLVALPLLIIAEPLINQRARVAVNQFVARDLIPDTERVTFDRAIGSALRLRNSVIAEALLLALIYGIVFLSLNRQVPLEKLLDAVTGGLQPTTWYEALGPDKVLGLTAAGWWMTLVSLPLFQLLLLRWYYRILIWARFLWQVSRMKLRLMPLNPDRCGGLGFLNNVEHGFTPILLAQGAVLSGVMANNIFYEGAKLAQFKVTLVGLVAVMLFVVLGPLLVFTPQLLAAKRKGMREYGALAQRYTSMFDQKWLRTTPGESEPLLGSADFQSLADLGNSYSIVADMRSVPFAMRTVLALTAITVLPVAPLLLTMIPFEELLDKLLKMIFFG